MCLKKQQQQFVVGNWLCGCHGVCLGAFLLFLCWVVVGGVFFESDFFLLFG